MENKSKGMAEAEISEAIIKFEKEYMGRGPVETRTYIIDDLIIIRLKGVLTRAEEQLAKSEEGLILIKQVRVKLLEEARMLLKTIVDDITGSTIVSMHTDISTVTGERVIIFTMNQNIEKIFIKK
ncbi:MAG TPA: DUF2294 domain-containing protein [Spirochaetota bacterium]|nr:DUF2294 domain-containing protein [Spirochaetota bacterium]HRZ25464.1 DUF2294 domain-containing protein [Spirochaetota bacterium]HSA16418.1 DUF2294 domain-containing protein [Spirochaetota bacterium]